MNCNQIIKSHQSLLKSALMLAICGSVHIEAQAALPGDAILAFDPGVVGGYYNSAVQSGSYFAMDTNGDGLFTEFERIAIEMSEGVRLGDIQPALGSHSGLPDGSELPSIDMPWGFFGNAGMHQTTAPPVIVNGDDGTGDNIASVDFSGWGVTWGGILNIPLGGDPVNFSDTGKAVITCSSACNVGDSYSLDYLAHVPIGDPSGFGGVFYTVHLEGVVVTDIPPPPPTKSVSIQLTGGNSQECSSTGGSVVEAAANIVTTDVNDIVSVNWLLDGENAGSGNLVNVFVPLGEHILNVIVDTQVSGMFDNSQLAAVSDHAPPELNIRFIDTRTGAEITEVTGDGKYFVTVRYDVLDICDSAPTATGVAVPVYAINDGDIININKKQLSAATLNTSAVNVSAVAKDASGNQNQRQATLLIID